VGEAVESGASRREAGESFDVSPGSAIKWMQRRQETGIVAPKPSGGSLSPLEAHADIFAGVDCRPPGFDADKIVTAMRKRWIPGTQAALRRSSTLLAARQFSPAAETETSASVLWFAAIQCIESKQDLPSLAPEGNFVSAEAVERIVGQIGETQKTTREISGKIGGGIDGFRAGAGQGFRTVCDAVRCRIVAETDCVSLPEHRIDNFSSGRINLAGPPKLTQMLSLDLEETGFHGRGTA